MHEHHDKGAWPDQDRTGPTLTTRGKRWASRSSLIALAAVGFAVVGVGPVLAECIENVCCGSACDTGSYDGSEVGSGDTGNESDGGSYSGSEEGSGDAGSGIDGGSDEGSGDGSGVIGSVPSAPPSLRNSNGKGSAGGTFDWSAQETSRPTVKVRDVTLDVDGLLDTGKSLVIGLFSELDDLKELFGEARKVLRIKNPGVAVEVVESVGAATAKSVAKGIATVLSNPVLEMAWPLLDEKNARNIKATVEGVARQGKGYSINVNATNQIKQMERLGDL